MTEFMIKSLVANNEEDNAADHKEEGKDLCNCMFPLAYSVKILLNTANLHLKHGHCFGLYSKNSNSKLTLMYTIVNSQVESFPSPNEVHTFYIKHDIGGSEAETTVLHQVLADKCIQVTEKESIKILMSVNFSDERQAQAIGSLSGSWKMKLASAYVMLNHLDKTL